MDVTIIPSSVIQDKRLSLKAIGLYAMIKSYPRDQVLTLRGLSEMHSDGIRSVRSGITELKRYGFLEIERERYADGTFGDYVYSICEKL